MMQVDPTYSFASAFDIGLIAPDAATHKLSRFEHEQFEA